MLHLGEVSLKIAGFVYRGWVERKPWSIFGFSFLSVHNEGFSLWEKNNFLKAEPLQGFQGLEENMMFDDEFLCIRGAEWKIPALP